MRRARAIPPAGTEALDARDLDPTLASITLTDLTRANTLFGLHTAVRQGLRLLLGARPAPLALTVLDVGAGAGDVLDDLRDGSPPAAGVRGIALDHHRTAARLTRARGFAAVVGDATALPFTAGSVDVVIASQLLHHVPRAAAVDLLRAFDRIARLGVLVADDRPSLLALGGFWVASHALAFDRVTRRDGLVSIRRGFTVAALAALCREARVPATVVPCPWWRVLAVWRTNRADR